MSAEEIYTITSESSEISNSSKLEEKPELENRNGFPELVNPIYIGEGLDYKVYKVADKEDGEGISWVCKIANNRDLGGNQKPPEMIEDFNSSENISRAIEDQELLKDIFDEHFLENHYTFGTDLNGEDSILLFQRYVEGKTLDKLIGEGKDYLSLEELVSNNREQFMDLYRSTLIAFQKFGIPIDVHEKNFIMDSKTRNIFLIDWGRPSEEYNRYLKSINALGGDREDEMVRGVFKRIEKIKKIEEYLKISDEDRDHMDTYYGVSTNSMLEKIKFLEEVRDRREEVKIEKRRQSTASFLAPIFGDREDITGGEIIEATERFIKESGITEVPKTTQNVIDIISSQGTEAKNLEDWTNLMIG